MLRNVWQDFIGSDVKNWRGLFIALLVIAAILGIILLVILIVTPGTKNNLVFLQGRRYRCKKVGLTYSGRSQVGKVGWTYLVTVHHIAIRVHFLSFPHWAEYGGRAETIPAQNQRLRVYARPTLFLSPKSHEISSNFRGAFRQK